MELWIVILRVLAPIFLILGLGQELLFDLRRKFREKTLRRVKLHMAISVVAMVGFCFMVSPDGGVSGKVFAVIIPGLFYVAFKLKARS